MVEGVDFCDDEMSIKNCETCSKGKMTKLMFEPSESKTTKVLELIHTDLMGPMETLSFGHESMLSLSSMTSREKHLSIFRKQRMKRMKHFCNSKDKTRSIG